MSYHKKDITFFYSNPVEKQTVIPVCEEAKRRGYKTSYSDMPFKNAEIGLYCQHRCFPSNSKLSFIMLHDMGQGQLHWPNIWKNEPWNDFDAGFLPGDNWSRRWQDSSAHPFSRPRLGVFNIGWPKSDAGFAQSKKTSDSAMALNSKLDLQHDISVLYAPAWENDNKQDEFVTALMELPVNLLLKQFPWTDEWPHMIRAVAEMNELHKDIAPNVHIIDPNINIMHALELADIVVSEESSVLIEALLFDKIPVSVSDWLIPDTEPPRLPAAPFDSTIKTSKHNLRPTIVGIINDIDRYSTQIVADKKEEFSNLGKSSSLIMDLIDSIVESAPLPLQPVQPLHPVSIAPQGDIFRKHLKESVYTFKYLLGIKSPIKKTLKNFLAPWKKHD